MQEYFQGDIIRISSFKERFLIVSKNAFIRSTDMFHVCPFFDQYPEGPLHIPAKGAGGTTGVAIAEQIKLIDPRTRRIRKTDHLPYRDIMEISDAIQGVFEYD